MAGFSNIGEPGYGIAPPLLSQQSGSSGYIPLGIYRPTRQYSPYFNPGQYQMGPQTDSSNQHAANVYMAQNGIGETGQSHQAGLADYGFSPEDWAHINNYLSNPQSQNNINNYMDITKRMGIVANNPQFASWTPEQRQHFSTDFPTALAGSFNNVPPPTLQSWGMGFPNIPGIRSF